MLYVLNMWVNGMWLDKSLRVINVAKRDYYFDNAKFLLIFLVVFGHFLQSYIGSNIFISYLYNFIYTFHMPAFILVSGYFAKGIYKKGYLAKITKKLILPYALFQIVYAFFYYFQHADNAFKLELFKPFWSLWFLISLFCWNLMLLLFNKLKPSVAFSIAVGLGLAAGYFDWISSYLSLSRTFVFFPFFLAGYFLNKNHFQLLVTHKGKIAATAFMSIVAVGILLMPDLNEKWFFGSKSYQQLDSVKVIAMWKRAGLYAVQFGMAASFLAFVPKRRFFFTDWGRNTLYVYLLHGFIVRIFRGSQWEDYVNQIQTIPILVLVSFILTALLSSKYVTLAAEPLIELKMTKWRKAVDRMLGQY